MAAKPASKARSTPEMLYAITGNGNKIIVSLASTDYTVPDGTRVKGIVASGDGVIKCDFLNSDGSTVTGYLNSPCWNGIDGIAKIYKTGTGATQIMLIVE